MRTIILYLFQSMEEMVSKTVPENIRLKRDMDLEEPYGRLTKMENWYKN